MVVFLLLFNFLRFLAQPHMPAAAIWTSAPCQELIKRSFDFDPQFRMMKTKQQNAKTIHLDEELGSDNSRQSNRSQRRTTGNLLKNDNAILKSAVVT